MQKGQVYYIHFYPRSPCGERPTKSDQGANNQPISIHALLAESDLTNVVSSAGTMGFLSTLSLRRATYLINTYHRIFGISIHALLAESDSIIDIINDVINNFYPRSPCGERRWLRCWQLAARDISIHALLAESDYTMTTTICTASKFLSTLSLRRATQFPCQSPEKLEFLSTLSLRRATANQGA